INNCIVSKVVKRTIASQGGIFLVGSTPETSMETMVRVRDSSVEESPMHFGMALTGWMIKNQRILNVCRNNDPEDLMGYIDEQLRSALSVPLRSHGKFIGALTVFNKRDQECFTMQDQRFLRIVAGQSAQVIETARLLEEETRLGRLQDELKVAGEIQSSLMPHAFPEFPGYEIFARNLPAGDVGGDCFDVLRIDDNRALLSLGDVSGKGASAALLMANAQAIIRSQFAASADAARNLGALVQGVSEYIAQWSAHDKYITLFLGTLDSANHRLEYVNAGHNPPLLCRSGGSLETLNAGGIPMGMFPDMAYETGCITFEPDERLVVFTDGVTELFNEDDVEFGDDRLERFVCANRECGSIDFTDRLYRTLEKYRGDRDPSDDITLLTVRRA
ncbi:MAG: GAF domain-containing SpoIIE family protein phosphatase, partial [Candidatus Zixiibacteriota bacterium]